MANPPPDSSDTRRATPAAPAPQVPPTAPTPAGDGINSIIRDIREGLAQISTRELELRRREQDFGRQYRELKQAAHRAAAAEFEQTQHRVAEQIAELNAKAVELAAKRARLNEIADQLRARQLELEQQRSDLVFRSERSRQQAEHLRAWQRRQHQVLKRRIAVIRQHERTLRQQRDQVDAVVARQRDELESRAVELDARTAQLAAAEQALLRERTALEQRLRAGESAADTLAQQRRELAEETTRLAQTHADLARRAAELDARAAELATVEQSLDGERAALARRLQAGESAAAALEQQREALADQTASLARVRDDLTRRAAELDTRAAQLDAAARGLDEERAALEQRRCAEESAAAEVERRRGELAEDATRLAQARSALAARAAELERQRDELAAASARFEAERGARTDHSARLQQERDELARALASVNEERAALTARAGELDRHQAELGRAAEALAADRADLARQRERLQQAEQTLAAQHARLDDERSRSAAATAELETERARVAGEWQQLEVATQALEDDRARLADERRGLEAAQRDLETARAALATPVEAGPAVAHHAAPRLSLARRTVVAAGVAALCALAWFSTHPAQSHATVRLRIDSAAASVDVTARHARQLCDPRLLDGAAAAPELAAAWRTACAAARVVVTAAPDEPVLWLSVTAARADEAEQLLRAAVAAHTVWATSGAGDGPLPAEYQALLRRHAQLESALQELHAQESAAQAAATTAPALTSRTPLITAADDLETELGALTTALDEQRAALAVLVATEVPRGEVQPTAVERALADDTIHREDRAEFQAVALEYRRELGVAMLLLTDPAKVLQKTLADFAATLAEQRSLDPPPQIAAVLEACATAVDEAQANLAPFVGQWQNWTDTVQGLDVSADVVQLVSQQNLVADAARQAAETAGTLLQRIGAQIETVDQSQGGTREVVVAAVLRGEQSGLKSAVDAFTAAAAKIAVSGNFELDARDRKLRGLRARLSSRRDTLQQQLQMEADRAAGETHAARVQAAREAVRQLERRREEVVASLVITLRQLRNLDDATRARIDAEAVAQRRASEIEWHAARLRELEQELVDAQPQGTGPELVTSDEPVIATRAPGRVRNSALAAGAGFGATWLLGALLTARMPGRRRRDAAGM